MLLQIKQSPAFFAVRITHKHTSITSWCKFISFCRLIVSVTETSKHPDMIITWSFVMDLLIRTDSTQNQASCLINQVSCCKNTFTPEIYRNFSLKSQCPRNIQYVAVLPFYLAILLRCADAGCFMYNSKLQEVLS